MKKLLLASSLFLTAAVSAFAADSTLLSPDVMVTLSSKAHARTGMSREDLIAQLGETSEKLSATVWAYWDFRAVGRPAGGRSDALVVILNNDRISRLRLTERSLVEATLLKLRANAAEASDAAGNKATGTLLSVAPPPASPAAPKLVRRARPSVTPVALP